MQRVEQSTGESHAQRAAALQAEREVTQLSIELDRVRGELLGEQALLSGLHCTALCDSPAVAHMLSNAVSRTSTMWFINRWCCMAAERQQIAVRQSLAWESRHGTQSTE